MSKKGGRRPGAGREPKLPRGRQSEVVTVRLTPAEYGSFQGAAGDELLGAYVRKLVLRHLARRKM